jgi:hypothetical protein
MYDRWNILHNAQLSIKFIEWGKILLKAPVIAHQVVKFGFVPNLHFSRRVHQRVLFNELRKNIIYRHCYHSVYIYTQARNERIATVTFAYGGRIDSNF